jgi:hypothetical protein
VGQTTKGTQYLTVKTNASIYIRQSSDDGTLISDGQLRELDGIGYAMSLSQIRRTVKFVDNGGDDEERCACSKRFGTVKAVGYWKTVAAASAKALDTVIWVVCIGIVVGVIIVVL